jgi:hypothetical protein
VSSPACQTTATGPSREGAASHRAHYRMNVRTGISVGPHITLAGCVILCNPRTSERMNREGCFSPISQRLVSKREGPRRRPLGPSLFVWERSLCSTQ